MEEFLIAMSTGLLLLLFEYFVILRRPGAEREPGAGNFATFYGNGNSANQVVRDQRMLVVNKVTNVHHDRRTTGGSDEDGDESSGEFWLWILGGGVAVGLLAFGLIKYGEVLWAVMVGVSFGLVLLSAALVWRGTGNQVPIRRWVTGCVFIAAAIAVGSFGIRGSEVNGVPLADIRERLDGVPSDKWADTVRELGGAEAMNILAMRALGAVALVACGIVMTILVTGAFAAIGALQAESPGRLQMWLVENLYCHSRLAIVALILFSMFGAALSGGWIGAPLNAQVDMGRLAPTP